MKRIQLDLKKRLPRKYYLLIDDFFLVFREPSFTDLEKLDVVIGFSPVYKQLLIYIDWNEDNLLDIIEFINNLPFRTFAFLIDSLNILFRVDETIEKEDLDNIDYNDKPKGSLNETVSLKERLEHKNTVDQLFLKTMETLGVYIKAQPPADESEIETPRSRAWIPLTQMMNPSGFQSVYDKLVYEGDKTLKTKENTDKNEDTPAETANPNKRISLAATLTREDYVKMIYENANIGYLKAATKGISQNNYRAALEKGVDPSIQDDRTRLIKDTMDIADSNQTITLRSRWKGGK